MDRVILHCDCNGFFASVECVYRPELKEVPMAVCGDPESRHGIILAKNELAKKYGVTTAETIWQAKKKCPDLVLVPSHHGRYEEFSRRINRIYEEYTDLVEPFSIDESFLDVTGSVALFGDGKTIADTLRKRVREEIGVTISVGVSYNKFFAKLGSDYKKPDATTVISRENYQEILFPLPVSTLLYVGKSSREVLNRFGIHTVGDLALAKREDIVHYLGKNGESLWMNANGLDESPVKTRDEEREAQSVGNGMTFRRNLLGKKDILAGVRMLSDSVAARLRKQGLYCRTVQVTIRDPDFKTICRQKAVPHATHLADDILRCAYEILQERWDFSKPIRMLTITAEQLTDHPEERQLSFFEEPEAENNRLQKKENLESAIDKIRGRFGKGSLQYGNILQSDIVTSHKNEKDFEENHADLCEI